MRRAIAAAGAMCAVSCGGGGFSVEATLEQALAPEVRTLQIAFLARPQSHDCRFILGNGCLASQDKPLVELADGTRRAVVDFKAGPQGQDVRIEAPVGKYMLVVEALAENGALVGNACDPLVTVRPETEEPLKITVRAWQGPACVATIE